MQLIPVIYHRDPDAWWADSPVVEGWTATAATLDELRQLVEDGIRFALGRDDDIVVEHALEEAGVARYAQIVFDFVAGRAFRQEHVVGATIESQYPQNLAATLA